MAVVPITGDGRVTNTPLLDANEAQIAAGSLVVALVAILFVGVLALAVSMTRGER